MPVIAGKALRKSFGARAVLEDVSLTLKSGERVGLIGRNGSGKSTLGRILAGLEVPDGGEIAVRRGAQVGYLAQEPAFAADHTVREAVMESLGEWREAAKRHEECTEALADPGADAARLVDEQARAAEAVERLGGWERLHEAEAVVSHLGIADAGRPVAALSGGERRRVALAQLLVADPDLAILDEPTNHLDVPTIEWLETFLVERFRGALLLITHDRALLEEVTSRTLELHRGSLESYTGGYAAFLEAKLEREAHAERTERNRQNMLRREVEWLRRGPKARTTKQKARVGRALKALAEESPEAERVATLHAEGARQGKAILRLDGLRLERDGHVLVEDLELDLRSGERLGVLGANGSGKTSLLLALQGELEAAAGVITLGANTRIGYLDQSRAGLDPAQTVREAVAGDQAEVELGGERLRVGSYLERFLFDGAAQRVRVSELSGGERARVCLARLLREKTNLLLLDEPTNDLDVATLGALEAMLIDYTGCALIVSHDRWFLDRVATSLLVFEGDGSVTLHAGSYSAYRERSERAAAAPPAVAPKLAAKSAPPSRPVRAAKLSYAERRELDGIVEQIEAAEGEVSALEERLADPATYQQGGDEIATLKRTAEEARGRAADLTARWEELEGKAVG